MKFAILQRKYLLKYDDSIEFIKKKLSELEKDQKFIIHSPIFFNKFFNKFFDEIIVQNKERFIRDISKIIGDLNFIFSMDDEIYIIRKNKIVKGKKYLSYEIDGLRFLISTDFDNLKPQKDVFTILFDKRPYYIYKEKEDFDKAITLIKNHSFPFIHIKPYGFFNGYVFEGESVVFNQGGKCISVLNPFNEDFKEIDLNKDYISFQFPDRFKSMYDAIICGIRDFFMSSGTNKAVIGISGGIDSALVLVLAAYALGKENVYPLFLPSIFTTTQSRKDAFYVANTLGVKLKEVSIDRIFNVSRDSLLSIFGQKPFDVTEENMQARIRGYLLMAYANKIQGIVLATGNKSEIAMGYCTLYGDTVGGLAPIGDLLKKDVYGLARYINENIITVFNESLLLKPPSAELRKEQKDEDDLPKYEILDEVLQMIFEKEYSYDEIIKSGINKEILDDIIKRIRRSEFKRRQLPMSIKLSKFNFGNIKIPIESEV